MMSRRVGHEYSSARACACATFLAFLWRKWDGLFYLHTFLVAMLGIFFFDGMAACVGEAKFRNVQVCDEGYLLLVVCS